MIEEQFGPIIRGIVEDRLLLERLPGPTSSASYLAIQQVTTRCAMQLFLTAIKTTKCSPTVLRFICASLSSTVSDGDLFCCWRKHRYGSVVCVALQACAPCRLVNSPQRQPNAPLLAVWTHIYLSFTLQSFGVKPVLDLDDYHAKLMRDYLVRLTAAAGSRVFTRLTLTWGLREV